MGVGTDILKSEITQTLAKEAATAAVGKVAGAVLPVDPVAVVKAFKGLTDGHISAEDIGEVGGVVAGAAAATVGGWFGISPAITRPIGEFIGKKVIGGIAKGFAKIFGGRRKAKARREFKRKVAKARAQIDAAVKGLQLQGIMNQRLLLMYDLADAAAEARLFADNKTASKAIAAKKILGWFDEYGLTRSWIWDEHPEWMTGGKPDIEKAGRDPKVGEVMERETERLHDAAEEIAAILAALETTAQAARETAQRVAPPQLTAGGEWSRRYLMEARRRAKASGKTERQAAAELHQEVTQFRTSGRNFKEAFLVWEQDFAKRLQALQLAVDAKAAAEELAEDRKSKPRPKRKPAPKRPSGASLARGGRDADKRSAIMAQLERRKRALTPSPEPAPMPYSPRAVTRRPQVSKPAKQFDPRIVRAETVVRSARAFSPSSSRAMTVRAPLGVRRRLQWRPLSAAAALMVRRFVPGVSAAILTGSDTKGVTEGGAAYLVEAGDSPWKIAEKLTGNGAKWKDLVRANPKKSTGPDGSFKFLSTGERLSIPEAWRVAAAEEIQRRKEAVKDSVEEVVRVSGPAPTPDERINGVSADAKTYVVRPGDSAWRIAENLTGNGGNWKELIRANPKKAVMSDGNFRTLSVGERIKLPSRWTDLLKASDPEPEPAPQLPPAPDPVLLPDPVIPELPPAPRVITSPGLPTGTPKIVAPKQPEQLRDDAEAVAQAKALLVAWSRTDGKDVPAGVVGYGTSVADVSPIWGARDRLQLQAFATWSNVARDTRLDVKADLTQAHLDALRAWAESRVSEPLPIDEPGEEFSDEDLRVIEKVPETVISGGEEKKKGGGAAILFAALAAIAASQLT